MQQQMKIEDPGFAPSFSCYSSNSTTSRAVAKAINEEAVARLHENGDVEGDDFEFVLALTDEITGLLGKLFISEREESSSSEADELDSPPKAGGGSSPVVTKCKKSSSTGSRSKGWIFRYLLRRSNSEGKEPMVVKKVHSPKHRGNSGEVMKVGVRLKAQTPVHEQFYVQRRAENEAGKRKTYLPYRKDLVGLFAGKVLSF